VFSFSGLLFHGLGCREFTISVRFGAQGTRSQFTRLLDRCATSSTGHREYLFPGEFIVFDKAAEQHGRFALAMRIAQALDDAPTKWSSIVPQDR